MADQQNTLVKVYGAEWCAPCHATKDYLKSKKIGYEYINVDDDREAAQALAAKTGWSAIPIVQIGDEYILGFNREKIDGAMRQAKLM